MITYAQLAKKAAVRRKNVLILLWSSTISSVLPRLERTRFISGRPRKRKPPDLTALLPGFPP